jgi:hypothetical protein
MATTGSIGILLVYVLVAVAVCGYTIYASIWPRPPALISYSLWIALALLIAGLIILAVLVVTRPDRVRSFGRAFETGGHS